MFSRMRHGAIALLVVACGTGSRLADAVDGDVELADSAVVDVEPGPEDTASPELPEPEVLATDTRPPPADEGAAPDADEEPDVSAPDVTPTDTAASGPAITSLSPEAASFRGGVTLTIRGAALVPTTSVYLGDLPAVVTSSAAGEVVVTVPPSAVGGEVDVRLETAEGTASAAGFRYLGLPPPLLRWVEVPGQVDLVPAEQLIALERPGAGRVVAVSPAGLYLLDADETGRLALSWSDNSVALDVAAACAADFDHDGDDDLWLAESTLGAGIYTHEPTGLSAPLSAPPLPVTTALCGDVTGDGHADVLVAVAPDGGLPALRVLVGDGNGGLAAATGGIALTAAPTALALADVDGDGHGDVMVGRAAAGPRLLLGDGFGGLVDAPAGATPSGKPGQVPTLGDLTGDGHADAFLISAAGAAVWVNDGAGRLLDSAGLAVGAPGFAARQVTLGDLDVDGALDVLAVGDGAVAILRNDGTGRLFDYTDAWLARVGAPAVLAVMVDADGDLDPDLLALRDVDAGLVLLRSWDPAPFFDPDFDSIPTELDVCPDHADPKQENRDIVHFRCPDAASCLAETGCALSVAPSGRAYLYCPAANLPLAAAVAFCRGRSAEPLFFDDTTEQSYVASLGTARVWMDLTDAAQEGAFVSSTGATPPFTSWGAAQPDNAGAGEHCIELIPADPTVGLLWNDLPCDQPRGVVCEDIVVELDPDPADACDVCPLLHDPAQLDADGDGIGDACEVAP